MPDLKDGESAEVQGSARTPYILKNVGRRLLLHLPGVAKPVGGHRTPHLQAPPGLPRRTGGAGPARLLGSGSAQGRERKRDTAPKLLLAHPGKTIPT